MPDFPVLESSRQEDIDTFFFEGTGIHFFCCRPVWGEMALRFDSWGILVVTDGQGMEFIDRKTRTTIHRALPRSNNTILPAPIHSNSGLPTAPSLGGPRSPTPENRKYSKKRVLTVTIRSWGSTSGALGGSNGSRGSLSWAIKHFVFTKHKVPMS